ncbi:MAG: DUF983 domain-containing protein [Alphaproteobacteria bacterium]|nr:DUF983 domain-containing protein [Alphaproteobacteria bacterium]
MPADPARATPPIAPPPLPRAAIALRRGLSCRCPACGEGALFAGFLRPRAQCSACGTRLDNIRADDAPPYFTIFAVGHIVIPLMLMVERSYKPDLWLHAAIWLPLTLVLALAFIRPIKGATLGVMMALGLAGHEQQPDSAP